MEKSNNNAVIPQLKYDDLKAENIILKSEK